MNSKNSIFELSEKYIEWLKYGRPKPVTKQTLRTYKDNMRFVIRIWGGKTNITKIDEEDVLKLKKDMIDRNLSIGYVGRMLSFVRAFLRYCDEIEHLKVLPPEKIKLPPDEPKEVKYNTKEELEQLFELIDTSTIQGVRFLTLVAVILDTGGRLNEVLSLNKKDIFYYTDEDGERAATADIIGKGGRPGVLMFHDWSLKCIDKYLELRTDGHEALFVSHNPYTPTTRFDDRLAQRYFIRASNAIGKPGIYTAHTLRRSASTLAYENGMDIYSVQSYLRHTDVKITQRYVAKNTGRPRKAHKKFVHYGGLEKKFVTAVMGIK